MKELLFAKCLMKQPFTHDSSRKKHGDTLYLLIKQIVLTVHELRILLLYLIEIPYIGIHDCKHWNKDLKVLMF